VKEVDKNLKSLPWVDKDSIKINYEDWNATFRVPDMSEFDEKGLRDAFSDRNIIIRDVQKL
jgi:hypothetical protein